MLRDGFVLCSACEAARPVQPFPMLKTYNAHQMSHDDSAADGLPHICPHMFVAPAWRPHPRRTAWLQAHIATAVCAQPLTEAQAREVVHAHIICDGCQCDVLMGPRFKCTVRRDFDLCASCEAKEVQPFPMIKLYTPAQRDYLWLDRLGPAEHSHGLDYHFVGAPWHGCGHGHACDFHHRHHPHHPRGNWHGSGGRCGGRHGGRCGLGRGWARGATDGFAEFGRNVVDTTQQVASSVASVSAQAMRTVAAAVGPLLHRRKCRNRRRHCDAQGPVTVSGSPAGAVGSDSTSASSEDDALNEEILEAIISQSLRDMVPGSSCSGSGAGDSAGDAVAGSHTHSAAGSCGGATGDSAGARDDARCAANDAHRGIVEAVSSGQTGGLCTDAGADVGAGAGAGVGVGVGCTTRVMEDASAGSATCSRVDHVVAKIGDPTLPAGARVECGSRVRKVWTVRNAGSTVWPDDTCLSVYPYPYSVSDADGSAYSDAICRQFWPDGTQIHVGCVDTGEVKQISAALHFADTVPNQRYVCVFCLECSEGVFAGDLLVVDVVSSPDASRVFLSSSMSASLEADVVASLCASHKGPGRGGDVEWHMVSSAADVADIDTAAASAVNHLPSAEAMDDLQGFSNTNTTVDVTEPQAAVVSPARSRAPASRWTLELASLAEMGFTNIDQLVPLLQRHVAIPRAELDGSGSGAAVRAHTEGMQRLVLELLGASVQA